MITCIAESQSEDDFEDVYNFKGKKKETIELQEALTGWKATSDLDRRLLFGVLSKR